MRRKHLDQQLSLKVAGPLMAELEAEAVRLDVPLSEAARRVLVEWATQRVLARETSEAA